jgi:hypothetical protein
MTRCCRIHQRFAVWFHPVRETPPQLLFAVVVYA